jgi:alanyl-tRNA synthetase
MTTNEIRSKFLDYMKEKGHIIVQSASLVPENDPTTLFTGSGMQPMIKYFLGEPHPLGKRITDSQKCFRSQDIEEVGDNRHTTFFEMLGNWSFGDYFKEEQIEWMWDFLIDELHLDPKNFYVTCFKGNDEFSIPRDTFSADLWKKLFLNKGIEAEIGEDPEANGMQEGEHIFYYDDRKNWWSRSGKPASMPEGEPGGPDTEMFYDFDPDLSKKIHGNSKWKDEVCHVNCDCGRFMEIGNNVFMQYKKVSNGFEELPQMNVDHGSGLERYAAALRNDPDMLTIDVFEKAREILELISNKKYGQTEEITFAMRVIMDHIRAASFLIGDGVMPGNKDQMYYVRRLIRRAVRFGRNLNIHEPFTKRIADAFISYYKTAYPLLSDRSEKILEELEKEENKFRATLEKGMKEFERVIKIGVVAGVDADHLPLPGEYAKEISGIDAFNLLQSFGFPIELTEELAKEKGINVDRVGFDKAKEKHAEESRTASAGKFKGGLGGDGEMETKYHTATHLLHEALRQVLGEQVTQKGSNITAERLRFDFSFDRKMTDDEKKKVEDIINDVIAQDLPVIKEEVTYEEARERGAIGLFDEKYGEKVSIYTVGESGKRGVAKLFSMEFCGGPHVTHTGVLGKLVIQKEEAVSAGVRRIKAVLL